MKNIFIKKILSSIAAVSVAVTALGMSAAPVWAFDAPQPDTGAAGGISNGGEWSIYSSRFAKIRGTFQEQTGGAGALEVTGAAGIAAAFQFDLSTKDDNAAANGKVIKSAKLRLTPMIGKSNAQHKLYKIDNGFTTTDGKTLVGEFTVPRTITDDFNSDGNITSLTADGIDSYPEALSNWQTDIDVTGEVITAEDAVSFLVEYSSGNANKTEYATSDISLNGRGQACPLLYSDGAATEYSKWIYPQIVFEYSDKENYKSAYADFVKANNELSAGKTTEEAGITLSAPENGSTIALEMYGDASQPAKIDGNSVVYNDEYVGDEDVAYVKLTVTNTDEGGDVAQYSRLVTIPVEYVRANTIAFDTTKTPKGAVSITSSGTTYTDGIAYAKPGGVFTVNDGANTSYEANVTVTMSDDETVVIPRNDDGTYTMPDGNVSVSVSYEKRTYGAKRIAAINSASIRRDGSVAGVDNNITIGAGRLAFLKFDLSGYNNQLITSAKLSVSTDQSYNQVSTAIFYIPNNDWSENAGLSADFCIESGDDNTRLGAFDGSVNLFNDYNQVAPGVTEDMLDKNNGEADLSSAKDGVLADYFLGSYNAGLTLDVTDAIRKALRRNAEAGGDGEITLMIYSPRTTGFDIKSIASAASLSARPSLTITESAALLTDEELVTEINTASDLETFAEQVSGGNDYAGKTVTLNNDIDLSEIYNKDGESWEPIGGYDPTAGEDRPFAGTFEGNNRSVSGLYIKDGGSCLGLFGSASGSIKDLSVSGEINGSSIIGGIAGWSSGSIENCSADVDITAQREAGGIVGTLSYGTVSGCSNGGDIEVGDKETFAGGIAGHNIGGVISDCENTGAVVNGLNGFRNKIGGIAGYLDGGEIISSQNTGTVQSYAERSTYVADETQNYVGGIVGYSARGVISDAINSGDVHNAVDFAGGIAGYLKNDDEVTDCYNSGAVSGRSYVGGIAGSSYSAISNCQNDGAVTAADKYAGGVVGYLSSGDIKDSYSSGNVAGAIFYGDIFGYNAMGTVTFTEPETEFKAEYVDGKAVVTAPEAGEYALIFAAYNSSGVLKSLEVQEITFAEPGTQTFEPTNFDAEGMTVKLMLWDGIDSMQPKF